MGIIKDIGRVINSRRKSRKTSNRTSHLLDDTAPFEIKEAYKSARTNLMFSINKSNSKIVVVTSAWPAEGKTTTCINLAIAFAQTGSKILIIDADLRKPRVAKLCQITEQNGLTNALMGFCTIDEAIHKTQFENLDALISGHIPPNPAELLTSPEMGKLLEDLAKKYDYIFIDTPPVNMVTDATIVASRATGTILVARQDVTDHRAVKEAVSKLKFAGARFLGFILNDVKSTGQGYYRYKYKKGYSKYGYYRTYKYSSYEESEEYLKEGHS